MKNKIVEFLLPPDEVFNLYRTDSHEPLLFLEQIPRSKFKNIKEKNAETGLIITDEDIISVINKLKQINKNFNFIVKKFLEDYNFKLDEKDKDIIEIYENIYNHTEKLVKSLGLNPSYLHHLLCQNSLIRNNKILVKMSLKKIVNEGSLFNLVSSKDSDFFLNPLKNIIIFSNNDLIKDIEIIIRNSIEENKDIINEEFTGEYCSIYLKNSKSSYKYHIEPYPKDDKFNKEALIYFLCFKENNARENKLNGLEFFDKNFLSLKESEKEAILRLFLENKINLSESKAGQYIKENWTDTLKEEKTFISLIENSLAVSNENYSINGFNNSFQILLKNKEILKDKFKDFNIMMLWSTKFKKSIMDTTTNYPCDFYQYAIESFFKNFEKIKEELKLELGYSEVLEIKKNLIDLSNYLKNNIKAKDPSQEKLLLEGILLYDKKIIDWGEESITEYRVQEKRKRI